MLSKRDTGRFVEQTYSDDAAAHAIPKTFKIPPYLRIYDGTTDPKDHVTHYDTAVKGNDLTKEQVSSILLKQFGETLMGGAISQLPTHSIESFEEMDDNFVTAHAGAKKVEARVNDIFAIKQSLGEGLRDFLARFNLVRMTMPNVSKGMAVTAFQNEPSREGSRATRKLLSRFMSYPPTTWDKVHNAYYAEVRADEDDLNGPTHRLTSVQAESRKERRDTPRRDHPIPRPNREQHQPYIRTAAAPSPRYEEKIVYALEKLGPKVTLPPKMRSDPNTRKSDALCEFHQERGHKTEDCTAPRGRTNFAKGREHQRPPKPPSPARTIKMIIGGGGDASINSVKFTTTHKLKRSITRELYDELEESIIFDKSDVDSLDFPHNEALVITLRILDTDVKCIMIDEGSGACIIHP
uniref:Retrotransposon gag domain-containing protein n=1 Tax=Nicotiana tabacum TaxID=4097 RepID=A0A1S3YSV8_TOBAC|nr:PREDICTED: uncharacterized protein LOC107779327 [Nicotiana tabacum]